MSDAELQAAIERLRQKSEEEAARIAAEADARIAAAGDAAAHRMVLFGAWLSTADADAIAAVFEQEIQREVIATVGPMLNAAVADDLASFVKATGTALRPTQIEDLAKALQFNTRWLPKLPDMTAVWVDDQLRGAVTGKVKTIQVIDGLRQRMTGTMAQYARTQVETTLQTMDQITIQESTLHLGYDLFIYAGPNDIIARPFCHACVNKAFPRAALEASDNGQIPGVMISRGGYNCRHRIRPATRQTIAYLKLPIIDPWMIQREVITEANPKKGRPERAIAYPVPR